MLQIFQKPSLCFIILIFAGLTACKNKPKEEQISTNEPTLFTLLTPEETGVGFQNILNEGLNTNISTTVAVWLREILTKMATLIYILLLI
jgi:hypothetical protein